MRIGVQVAAPVPKPFQAIFNVVTCSELQNNKLINGARAPGGAGSLINLNQF